MIPSIIVPAATQMAAQPVAPVSQAAVAPVPANAAQSLIYQSVPANSAPVSLFNNIRGGGTDPLESRSSEVIAQAFQHDAKGSASRSVLQPRYGASSAFLAQAISQEEAANDNSVYREFELSQEEGASVVELSLVPQYIENNAQHLSSLQRVSIKAYQTTASRNAVNLNQQNLLNIARSA